MTISTVWHIRGDIFEITDDEGKVYGLRVIPPEKADKLLEVADGQTPIDIWLDEQDALHFDWQGVS